jgi:glycosyltransferase involved in cell wall biosynthesis
MADSTPLLSIVIPCLNEARTIEAQLRRLTEEDFSEPWEIIVADNGSTDGTRDMLRKLAERISNLRFVDASSRRGVNPARNTGAAAARGEFVLFCDADDEIQPGWLAAMGNALKAHDVVAGRIDSELLNEAWSIAGRGVIQTEGLPSPGRYLPYGIGANLGVRRSLHERIGGFDEAFVGGADDVDYCWRLQQVAGAELYFEPRAVVAYRIRGDVRSLFRQGRFYGVGWVSLYKKHRDSGLPKQRHPWLLGVLSWLGMLGRLPIPPSKRKRASFAWNLGWKLGLLEGSVRNRVVLLSIRGIV